MLRAGGQIAVQSMKGAATDGSVPLLTPASMLMIYPHIYEKLAYDDSADVTAVSLGYVFDFGWCVGPSVLDSIKTRPEFPSIRAMSGPAATSARRRRSNVPWKRSFDERRPLREVVIRAP